MQHFVLSIWGDIWQHTVGKSRVRGRISKNIWHPVFYLVLWLTDHSGSRDVMASIRSESLSLSWQSRFNCQICQLSCSRREVRSIYKGSPVWWYICKGSPDIWWKLTNCSESPTLDNFAVGDKKHNWGEDRLTNYCFGKRRTLATLAREGAGGLFDKHYIESHLDCHL